MPPGVGQWNWKKDVYKRQVLRRLRELVNPDLLDLRQERDLGDMLGVLMMVTAPMLYSGLQAGAAPGARERLENILEILRRGMGREKLPGMPNHEGKEN